MTERWEAIPSFRAAKQHAEKAFFGRVSFYLWQLFQRVSETYQGANGNTCYFLIRGLIERDEEFALITFNYDTLLDRAVKEVHGATLESLGSYLSVPLIKPHGSVNWLLERDSDPGYRPEGLADEHAWLSRASSLMFNGGEFAAKDWTVVDKWYDMVTGFHGKMIQHAQREIRSASDVYVIGYSAADDVFAQIMESAQIETRLHVVGRGEGAAAIADRITKRHPQLRSGKTYSTGFQHFVEGWI